MLVEAPPRAMQIRLGGAVAGRRHATGRPLRDEGAEIEPREPRPRVVAAAQEVAAPDHILQPGDAELRHQLARTCSATKRK